MLTDHYVVDADKAKLVALPYLIKVLKVLAVAPNLRTIDWLF